MMDIAKRLEDLKKKRKDRKKNHDQNLLRQYKQEVKELLNAQLLRTALFLIIMFIKDFYWVLVKDMNNNYINYNYISQNYYKVARKWTKISSRANQRKNNEVQRKRYKSPTFLSEGIAKSKYTGARQKGQIVQEIMSFTENFRKW